jgi:AraC-like DNA-binding protein
MLNVFEPGNEHLKKYVDSIYIFEKKDKEIRYTSYPSAYTAVALFRNTDIDFASKCCTIQHAINPNHFAVAFNRLFRPVDIHYRQMEDEISINFKALGLAAFAQWEYKDSTDCFIFSTWDNFLEDIFNEVFAIDDPVKRIEIIEAFLLKRYVRFEDEEILSKAIDMLNAPHTDHKMQEIAKETGVHYKYLYRSFMQYIGCSPAHYRKIVKFRHSVYSKLNKGDAARFIEICYDGNYTDQSYFIKQFREITGENPKKFFRGLSAFGKDKVVLRFS